MSVRVEAVDDERALAVLLNRDRAWAVYGLCDLDRPLRQHARFIGAWNSDGTLVATVMVFSPVGFTSVVPFGSSDGVHAILASDSPMPTSALFHGRESDLPLLSIRYELGNLEEMFRMQVHSDQVEPLRSDYAMIERLGPDYATAAAGLYGESDEVFYAQFMLSTGVFYGAFRKEEMVAISGTHAVTKRYDMATVGGVFTHPEHRGHSLAKATTSHVVAAVREMGINDVALNVRQDNHPAIRAYERLGFRITLEFTEGTLSARESPPAAP